MTRSRKPETTKTINENGRSALTPLQPQSPPSWNLFRRTVVGILLGSAGITLIKVAFFPALDKNLPLDFPDRILLPEWQQETNPTLAATPPLSQPEGDKLLGFVNGKVYQYRQGNQMLNISMRYFSPTIGDVKPYLTYYNKGIPPNLMIREQKGVGYYGLFTQNKQAHLTTCLTPRGGNIFKREQFLQVRYQSDLRLERFLPWIMGKLPLLDNRCLWIDMSLNGTAENHSSSDYPTLEKAWLLWNQSWQPHFEQFQP